jgi:CTP synthase (UTP-ammonia lyase)
LNPEIKVAVIGDFNPSNDSHRATVDALKHAADLVSITASVEWIATEELNASSADTMLRHFDGLWCAPGSPYNSMSGALDAIRFARERRSPFFGT